MKQFSGKKARGTSRMRYLWMCLAFILAGTGVAVATQEIFLAEEDSPVARVGSLGYATLAEAVAAANEGETVEVLVAGSYSLPNLPKNVTIEGKVDDVVFNHTSAGNVASVPNGATFKNVTFNFGNQNYHGFQHAGLITMDGCTINGKFFSYGDMNFTGCQFVQDNADYHMWVYGKGTVNYTNCTFTNNATGKFLHLYSESSANVGNVTVTGCTFINNSGSASKAAINVKATSGTTMLNYTVSVSGDCTTEGAFPAPGVSDNADHTDVISPLIQVDDRTGSAASENITVELDNVVVYDSGSEVEVVEISTVAELKAFREAVNSGTSYNGKIVRLTADLDLSDEDNWTPIGNLVAYPGQSFHGTFDGAGHTIDHLKVDDSTPKYAVAGLFGSIAEGSIVNLTLTDVSIKSTHYAAGIVAYTSNAPSIINCHVIGGTITSTPELIEGSYDNGDKAGGIMGYCTTGTTIKDCSVEGLTVRAYRDLAGICGYAGGSVSDCTVTDVTVIQDNTNAYKTEDQLSTACAVVGGRSANASQANTANTTENVSITSAGNGVAQIGSTKYATIEEAVAAWGPGKTLTLLQDVTTTSTVTVEVNATKSTQNWTLDLGDHTWTASGCNAFQLYAAGGTVMNQNYGLKIYANQNGGITASGKYCIECKYDNSTGGYRPRLEIHGGTYNGSYIIYYYSSSWNSSSISNGPSTLFYKSNDGTEPVFNGNFGLYKCPIYLYAGYFNGTSFNTYPVNSTANTNLYGGHFKTISAFPSASNNKGIVYGNYKVLVKADASLDVINGAPATYEASTTSYSSILTSYRSTGYSGSLYFESANYAIQKYNIPIILNENVVATEDKSYSGTLTIDATAEGSAHTGNITLTGNNAKFIIKYPEGKGHYGVTASTGQLHVEESVADGIVTRTYSCLATISDPEAKVGDTGYSTVYDAFYAIDGTTDNKTIVLQKDVTNAGIVTNGTAVNAAGETVATFDLNGHSIGIGSVACGNNADYTLTIIDSSEGKTGTVTNSDASLFILALTGINDYSGTYNLKVQGGTWQFDPSCVTVNSETHDLVDEGYYARNNGNGTWTVCEAIATIGKAGYSSLAEAVAAANDGETITLQADCTGNGIKVPQGKFPTGLTIDFAGHTYTVDGEAVGSTGTETQAFQLLKENTITLKNGTVVANSTDVKMMIQNYSNLTLDGMTLDATQGTNSVNYVLSTNNGTTVINNTTITAKSTGIAFDVDSGWGNYASNSVEVTGTSVINGNIEVAFEGKTAGTPSVLTLTSGTINGGIVMGTGADECTVTKASNFTQAAPEGYKWVENGDDTSTLAPKVYVAQIGTTKYESLAEAVAAVPTDGTPTTITMIADETIVGNTGVTIAATQNVVLDLNGKTISQTGPMAGTAYLIRNNGTLTIMDSTDTEQNGTGNGKMLTTAEDPDTGSIPSYATNLISNYGTLSILSGYYEALTNEGYASYVVDNYSGGTANISGGKLCNNADYAYVVRMFLNSTTQTNALNISGTAIITGSYAVWMQYSNANANKASLNISGGTLEATDGYALYAGGNTRNATNITVDISGGHIGGDGAWLGSDTAFESISVSGGTFANFGVSAVGGSRFITGGTYTSTSLFTQTRDENTPILADTYEAVEYGSDMFVVEQVIYVAQIGDVKYKTLAEAVAAVPTDGTETTITMIASEAINVVGSAITIPANKNIILDLNGYQVVGTAESGSTSALITNKGTLTIKDSSDTNADGTGTGQLISGATTTWVYDGSGNYAGSYASNTITNTGTLTIQSGYIENLSSGSATYAVDNNSSGADAILNVQGGLLKARAVAVRQFANSTVKENTVNVTGGTIQGIGYAGIWVQLPGSDATQATKATLNVSGGNLTGGSYAFYDYSYGNNFNATQYNLSGGTYNGYVFSYGANIDITDGTYNGDVIIKQEKSSNVSVSGGKFAGDVYTYGSNASEGFITGGVFKATTYEYNDQTYEYNWIHCLAEQYINTDNTNVDTKEEYPYTAKTLEDAGYFTLIDGEAYERAETVHAESVTYRRTFKDGQVGKYQAWFVPFDYTIKDEDVDHFTFYKLDFVSPSTQSGVVEDNSAVFINIEVLTAGRTLKGNRPYIVKPNTAATFEFVAEDIDLLAVDESSRLNMRTSAFEYDYYGNMSDYTTTSAHELLAMNGGQICWNTAGAKLTSFRWYIKASSNFSDDDYSKIRFIFIDENTGEATDIAHMETAEGDEVDSYFTVDGMRMTSPAKGLNIVKMKSGKAKKVYIR